MAHKSWIIVFLFGLMMVAMLWPASRRRQRLDKASISKRLRLQEVGSEGQPVHRSRIAYLMLFPEEEYPLARCLDNSMAGYYLRRGSETKRFLIFLEGGGWCYDQSCTPTEAGTIADCKSRSATELGSSKNWGRHQEDWWLTGIMSSDYASNPVFYNWTTILVPYCDGASFTGNSSKGGLQFRGSMILEALIADLKKKTDISEAVEVVVAGRSAGASAVYYHIDKMAAMLSRPKGTVKGIADAGFFLNSLNKDGIDCWPDQMMSLWSTAGLYKDLHQPCLQKFGAGQEWKCLFAEFFAESIETPMFIVNSMYDTSELTYTLGLACCPGRCHFGTPHCNAVDKSMFDHLRTGHEKAWAPVAHKPGNGIWAISCMDHTLTWEHWTSPKWEVPSGSKTTAAVAVAKWLAGEDVHIQDAVPFPENRGCSDHNLVS